MTPCKVSTVPLMKSVLLYCVCVCVMYAADTACIDWVMCLYKGTLCPDILSYIAGGDIKVGRGGRHYGEIICNRYMHTIL